MENTALNRVVKVPSTPMEAVLKFSAQPCMAGPMKSNRAAVMAE